MKKRYQAQIGTRVVAEFWAKEFDSLLRTKAAHSIEDEQDQRDWRATGERVRIKTNWRCIMTGAQLHAACKNSDRKVIGRVLCSFPDQAGINAVMEISTSTFETLRSTRFWVDWNPQQKTFILVRTFLKE